MRACMKNRFYKWLDWFNVMICRTFLSDNPENSEMRHCKYLLKWRLCCNLAGEQINNISYITFCRSQSQKQNGFFITEISEGWRSEEMRPQRTFGGHMETLDVCDDESDTHSLSLKDTDLWVRLWDANKWYFMRQILFCLQANQWAQRFSHSNVTQTTT